MTSDNDFYKVLLDKLTEGVYFVDKEHRITFWNSGAERITGFSGQEVLGKSCSDSILVHVDEKGNGLCPGHCPVSKTLHDHKPRDLELYLHHKDGHRVPVSVRIFPIFNSNGDITGSAEIFIDNSSRIEILQRLRELNDIAMVDTLTGTASRHFLKNFLKQKIDEYTRYEWKFGIIFFDIDNFKTINDTYGHETGDHALKMVGTTFLKNIRSFDLVGRWGGDEFIVILSNIDKAVVKDISNKLCSLVSHSGIYDHSCKVQVSVSGGATLYNEGDTLETLINRADTLMYKSKKQGKNKVHFE